MVISASSTWRIQAERSRHIAHANTCTRKNTYMQTHAHADTCACKHMCLQTHAHAKHMCMQTHVHTCRESAALPYFHVNFHITMRLNPYFHIFSNHEACWTDLYRFKSVYTTHFETTIKSNSEETRVVHVRGTERVGHTLSLSILSSLSIHLNLI